MAVSPDATVCSFDAEQSRPDSSWFLQIDYSDARLDGAAYRGGRRGCDYSEDTFELAKQEWI